jgi:hypothetical protein
MKLFSLVVFFFFQKKKQKALFRFAEGQYSTQNSAKRTLGVWGRAPKEYILSNEAIELSGILLFPEKEAKSVVPLRGRSIYPKLREADPGGLGASPQRIFSLMKLRKRCSVSLKVNILPKTPRSGPWGFGG